MDATESSSPDITESPKEERFAHGLRQTWELELVISGAVAFALLQLPSAVDAVYDRIVPHLAGALEGGAFIVYYYAKLAIYTLIATFMTHIVARAYWVGLVGLEAVFPRGPRWDQTSAGPISRKFYQERLPSLSALIDRVDDFCSVIFSFSFMIVFIFISSIFWAGLLGLVAFGISRLFFGGERLGEIFKGLVFILIAPLLLMAVIDKAIGGKIDPSNPLAKLIRGMTAFYYRALCMNLYGPIMMTLFSNVRKKAIYPAFFIALAGVLGFFFLNELTRQDLLTLSSEIYLPAKPGEAEVSPAYYEDQRPEGEIFPMTPSIPSDVVDGPYVKLYIPYYPRRHNAAIERRCPGVKPLREEGLLFTRRNAAASPTGPARQVLGCLAQIHRVTLDGKPVPGLEFHFTSQLKTGLRGIVGYIPTAGLAPGSHLLRVEAVPRAEPRKEERPPDPYLIRFWI
jgi:hypothetical protein